MKFIRILFYRIMCFRTLDHTRFTLISEQLEYKEFDSKYYYFKDARNNKYLKVLKKENDEELDIYRNWLKNK